MSVWEGLGESHFSEVKGEGTCLSHLSTDYQNQPGVQSSLWAGKARALSIMAMLLCFHQLYTKSPLPYVSLCGLMWVLTSTDASKLEGRGRRCGHTSLGDHWL